MILGIFFVLIGDCDVRNEQVKKGLWKVVRLPNDVVLETKRMRDMELW